MNNYFITNEKEKSLAFYFENFIKESQNLDFLVGYFYFSGFQEISQSLKDKNIRILVGMDIELDLYNRVREIGFLNLQNNLEDNSFLKKENFEVKDQYLESLRKVINQSEIFDNIKSQEAFKIFHEKYQNGSLKIRKTKEPNHAKLYIFEKKEEFSTSGLHKGNVITGSSNLTLSGLSTRNEVNVAFYNQHFDEAQKLFNSLWEESVEIPFLDYEKKVKEKIWIGKQPKPILLYIKALKEILSQSKEKIIKPSRITQNKYQDFTYQIDAIAEGIDILNKHNGVIIADVVGLGKSIIASAIAHNLNLPTFIIAPPHLKTQWEENYKYEFGLNASVFSSGKLTAPLEALSKTSKGQKLIIIDEVHRFRNESTKDYHLLQKICQGNKVMLLTATPFSNRPSDVFSMIKLFQIPAKSTLQHVGNLSEKFRVLIKEYNELRKEQKQEKKTNPTKLKGKIKKLAQEIRKILEPLVIRRSRLDLQEIPRYKEELEKEGIQFPEIAPPQLEEYDLGSLSELYTSTLEQIYSSENQESFQAVRYKPYLYIKTEHKEELAKEFGDQKFLEESQINLAKFMQFLLVRRFESSLVAFRSSLQKMIDSYNKTLGWYRELGYIPLWKAGSIPQAETLLDLDSDNDDLEELEELTLDNEVENKLDAMKKKGLKVIPSHYFTPDFIELLEKDKAILLAIRDQWKEEEINTDPKYQGFLQLLKQKLKENKERKIIVFSEFADTATAIFEKLKEEPGFRPFLYTSAHATKANKNIIQKNFDAGLELDQQQNDYDILIATDAISEGYNLHRAGIVINYDIPYNPTRVIQRIGRINRINKKMFEKLYIYHFFPTQIGESVAGIQRISTFKMHLIQALVGEDTQILTQDEEISKFLGNRVAQELNKAEQEQSWRTPYEQELDFYEKNHPQLVKEANALPSKIRIGRKKEGYNKNLGTLLFAKKGKESVFKYCNHNQQDIELLSLQEGLNLMKANKEENAVEVSPYFENSYQNLKKSLKNFGNTVHIVAKGNDPIALARKNLEKLKILESQEEDYIEMLKKVLNYDTLSHYLLKKVGKANKIKDLKEEATPDFLQTLLEESKKVSKIPEFIILAQDFKGE